MSTIYDLRSGFSEKFNNYKCEARGNYQIDSSIIDGSNVSLWNLRSVQDRQISRNMPCFGLPLWNSKVPGGEPEIIRDFTFYSPLNYFIPIAHFWPAIQRFEQAITSIKLAFSDPSCCFTKTIEEAKITHTRIPSSSNFSGFVAMNLLTLGLFSSEHDNLNVNFTLHSVNLTLNQRVLLVINSIILFVRAIFEFCFIGLPLFIIPDLIVSKLAFQSDRSREISEFEQKIASS